MVLSVGIVPVRETEQGPRFLLLRCYGYWDFPKGEVEPGEDPLAAALRELEEEAGISGPDLPWGPGYYETPRYGRGKVWQVSWLMLSTRRLGAPGRGHHGSLGVARGRKNRSGHDAT